MLDQCFELIGSLSEVEKSNLYYIAGYVAHKENIHDDELGIEIQKHTASEFTSMVSWGIPLSHPTPDLFNLTCVLYSYYKNVNKECIEHLMVGFQQIYESCFLEFTSERKILRRLINTFSKAFSNKESDGLRAEKQKVKRRRLHYE